MYKIIYSLRIYFSSCNSVVFYVLRVIPKRKVSDGTYDKEGVYVGKVRVGLCTCNGCVMSRREVSLLSHG